jgi:quercetin dioxygenase-like cupin family protein
MENSQPEEVRFRFNYLSPLAVDRLKISLDIVVRYHRKNGGAGPEPKRFRWLERVIKYMDYKFIADLLADVKVPSEGVLSRVLQKDEHVNITLFGFSPGQELSTHSAPTPAVLYFLSGESDVTLGDDMHHAGTGSFAYVPPLLPHAIAAKTATMMLLVQIKTPKADA